MQQVVIIGFPVEQPYQERQLVDDAVEERGFAGTGFTSHQHIAGEAVSPQFC